MKLTLKCNLVIIESKSLATGCFDDVQWWHKSIKVCLELLASGTQVSYSSKEFWTCTTKRVMTLTFHMVLKSNNYCYILYFNNDKIIWRKNKGNIFNSRMYNYRLQKVVIYFFKVNYQLYNDVSFHGNIMVFIRPQSMWRKFSMEHYINEIQRN